MIRPLLLLPLLLAVSTAMADSSQAPHLEVSQAWSRALPPVAPTGAAYVLIENRGGQADQLFGVSTPMAERAEIHQHVHVGGVMRMQRVDRVDVAPGEQTRFAPGGYHIMLFGLKQPLTAGAQYPLKLLFKQAGEIEVQVQVREDAPETQPQLDQARPQNEHHH